MVHYKSRGHSYGKLYRQVYSIHHQCYSQIVTINVTDNGTSKRQQEVIVIGTANMVHYAAKSSELVGQQI